MQWVPVARLNATAKLVARRLEAKRLLGKRGAPAEAEDEGAGRRVSPRLAGETPEEGRENPEVRRARQGRRASARLAEGALGGGRGGVKRGRKPAVGVGRKRRAVGRAVTRGAAKRRREAVGGEEGPRAVRACRLREPARVLRPRG